MNETLLSLHEVKIRHVLYVLQICNGNKTLAAEKLGVSIRWLRLMINKEPILERFKQTCSCHWRNKNGKNGKKENSSNSH